jgi:hypothetical protein
MQKSMLGSEKRMLAFRRSNTLIYSTTGYYSQLEIKLQTSALLFKVRVAPLSSITVIGKIRVASPGLNGLTTAM